MADRLTPEQFAGKIRTKYPGQYDDLSDSQLTNKIIAKYPEYADMVNVVSAAPPMPPALQPQMQPSYFALALQNSPSNADPQNPANPTPEGLAQMSPEGRGTAQGQLATTAAATIPTVGPVSGAVAGGEKVLSVSEKMMESLAEHYPQLSKLAEKFGYGAGAAGAYALLKKITSKEH
jgi:hypothetical protein